MASTPTLPAVGVLGGTFDPVHLGHLHIADEVRSAFRLERMLLVPCFLPPHKSHRAISPSEDRLAMLRLAAAGRDGIEVSTVELDRQGVSYTIDTLRQLRASAGVDPLFVMGVDALAELPTWRQHVELTSEFDLVVVDRPGGSVAAVVRALDAATARRVVPSPSLPAGRGAGPGPPPGRGGRIYHLPLPPSGVSSREIRRKAAAGLPLDGLVPPPVARYIQERMLYREEELR